MRTAIFSLALLAAVGTALVTSEAPAHAKRPSKSRRVKSVKKPAAKAVTGPVPWCAPEVSELSDHTCWFDGGVPSDGRRTLVVYLHGVYAATPGFQHLQQKALALQATRHSFTLLLPTAPRNAGGYAWPTSEARQKTEEQAILDQIKASKADLERRSGKRFDETFVVGFSSGAYYASSLALRSALDVDGYIVLAGGSSWVRPPAGSAGRRAPVFVGVSASDRQTASHSRAFGATLAALGWPRRVEERKVGHLVDVGFMARGIAWLRSQSSFKPAAKTAMLDVAALR